VVVDGRSLLVERFVWRHAKIVIFEKITAANFFSEKI